MTDKLLIDRTLLEQALKCLETPIHEQPLGMRTQTASAFRAALAQQAEPVQEPLTDDEIMALWERHIGPISFARAIERKVRGEA